MSMAHAIKENGSLFICRLCRQKLFRNVRPTAGIARTFPRASSHPIGRLISTSPTLRSDDDGAERKPRAFPTSLRSGRGGFGSLGSNANSTDNATTNDGLTPAEREARAKAAPSLRPAAPPPRPAAPSHPQRNGDRQADLAQASQFNDVLSGIFSKNGKEERGQIPPRSDAWSAERTTQTSTSSSSGLDGFAFSGRGRSRDTIEDTYAKRQSSDDIFDAVEGKKPDPPGRTARRPSALGSIRATMGGKPMGLEEMGRLRLRTNTKPGKNEDGFWTELNARNTVNAEKKREQDEKTRQEWLKRADEESESESSSVRTRNYSSRHEAPEQPRDRDNKPRRQRQKPGAWKDDDTDIDAFQRYEERKARKAQKSQQTADKAEDTEAPTIFLPPFISVNNLAQAIGQKVGRFLRDLAEMGFEDLESDTIMTGDTAALVVMEYGYDPTVDAGLEKDLQPRPAPDDVTLLPPRPPIVTIMGHVDHGKTTLLDWLRKSSVAAQEHGGITQHIGAFVVKMSSGKPITFLDTPGHAAFLSMRQRGANVTDIVVLVVAADDSVMPQTLEALKHATAAKVPIIVAISKIDKEDARIDTVKSDLSRHGVEIEDYGGEVQVVGVSGKTGQGMQDLEENIVALSEVLDVRAETDGLAEGFLIESSVKLDGKAATVLVKRGTLRTGDFLVAGKTWARVRLLRNEAGVEVTEAPPGTPVEVLGWRELPMAGDVVLQAPDEDAARTAVDYRQEMAEREEGSAQLAAQHQQQREKAAAEAAAKERELYGTEAEEEGEPGVKYQNFVIKADVAGSTEAVSAYISEVGNNEVRPRILRSLTGQVSEFDIDHAAVSGSIIINFNNALLPHIKQRAEKASVTILNHTVIYHIVDDVKAQLSTLLAPTPSTRVLGEADVLQIFAINIKGRVFQNVAGCRVRNGTLKKGSLVKILRRGRVVHEGTFQTLKQGKKNTVEVGKGNECGLAVEGFEDYRVDDQIQTYEVHYEPRKL